MNPSNIAATRSSMPTGESLQRLASWLRRNGNEHPSRGHNLRQQMSARYPAGLLTEDELDALLAAAWR